MTARLHAESGLDPNAVNESGHRGTGQWDTARWAQLQQLYGGDTSTDKQRQFINWELAHTEAAAGAQLRAATTAHEVAQAMEAYERAGQPAFTLRAEQLTEQIAKGTAGGGTAGAGTGGGTAGAGTPQEEWFFQRWHDELANWWDPGPSASARIPDHVRSIQRSQAGAMVNQTNNVNVGGVTVHAPAREGAAIGDAVADRLDKLSPLVAPAATGAF
jgi:hypothetical protein